MVAENPADTDEQVIDLTELIEKGNVPADDASAQPSSNAKADGIQEQLNALNDSKAEIEGDIDDLLAQMDMMEEAVPGGGGQTPPSPEADAAPAASADRPVDPNEELFMPGMGDIDNLLNSLDIPPQPSAEAQPAAGTADQAVDAMLNKLTPDQPADAMISEDGLASLLAAIDGQQKTPQADPAAQPAADPLADDLDAILSAAAPEPPAAPQPEAAPAAPAASQADDLDALLAAAAPEPPAAPQPEAAPAAPAASQADDLDALLAAAAPETPAAPQPEDAPAAPAASPADDLDALLAAAAPETPAAPQPEDAPAAPTAYAVEDLDAVFADAGQQPEAPAEALIPQEETLQEPAAAPEETDVALETAATGTFSATESAPEGVPNAAEAAALAVDMPLPEENAAEPSPLISDAAPAAGMAAAGLKAAQAQAVEAAAQAAEASSQAVTAWEQAFEASSRAADAADGVAALTARLEQCEQALQEAQNRIKSLEHTVNEQAAAIVEVSRQQTPANAPEDALAVLFEEGHPLHNRLMDCALLAARQVLEQAAPADDPRVTQCEAVLQEAGERIAALENAVASQAATAQQQAETAPDAGLEALLNERLQAADTAARSAAARMDALEGRMDALEPRFNDRVEKAAAAAAARILREEISRLLEQQ